MARIGKKVKVLLLGYLVIWPAYFGIRIYQYTTMETATAEVTAIAWSHFTMYNRHGRPSTGSYLSPEVHFLYKRSAMDAGEIMIVWPRVYSVDWYKPGDKTAVIFPKGRPEDAALYSVLEFWLIPPYMVITMAVAVLWTVIYSAIVFKPWKATSIYQ